MCGIIGYTGSQNAVPIIVEGLKRLEYRGYDSAGIAIYEKDGIKDAVFNVIKQKGRLKVLEEKLKEISGGSPLESRLGIGHTRWATHGEPSDINSHPHLGNKGKIAAVHNGIIENYRALRAKLEEKGIKCVTQTDSEVAAQLAEYYYDGDILKTIIKVVNAIEGSYALGVMRIDEPGTLIAVRKNNPLIVGISEHGYFIASDVPAILKHTNKVCYLEDKEIAVLKSVDENGETKLSAKFYNADGEEIKKEIETITWNLDSAEKDGYEHFMLKEIMEQPKALRETINSVVNHGNNAEVIEKIDIAAFNKIVIAACGSAYNAGAVSKYVFEKLCRFPSLEVELASEFRYRNAVIDEKTLVILVSQSGETADTIAALREAKDKGATTLSIVNVTGSTIAKEADFCVYTMAGPEIAVATTKAFSTQLALLYILAVKFALKLGKITQEEEKNYMGEIASLSEKVAKLLKPSELEKVQMYAAKCIGYKSIFFIGRNIDYAIAMEGSLKLKEISYIHSEAYAGGELKHGTISLIEENTLVVVLANCERLFGKIMSNAEQVISRGAKALLISSCAAGKIVGDFGNENAGENSGNADNASGENSEDNSRLFAVNIPECCELFSPSLSVIVLQLFSYYVAANKGLDIDKPRNLAKSVTVE